MLFKMNHKKAFTMAETILVMTILGIIATIMITTLKPAQFKEKGLQVLAKKVLSEIDTATTQIIINNTKLGSFSSLVMDNATETQFLSNATNTMNFYKKYLTTLRTTVESNSFCITGGQSTSMAAKAVYLKDGACFGIKSQAFTANTVTRFPGESGNYNVKPAQGLILFDTNGQEEPNTIGKDRFILPIGNEGIMYDI